MKTGLDQSYATLKNIKKWFAIVKKPNESNVTKLESQSQKDTIKWLVG